MTPPTLLRPSVWTLRAKIVASVLALFLGVTLATGVATVLLSKQYLTRQLDSSITSSIGRATGQRPGSNGGDRGPGPIPGNGDSMLRLLLDDGAADPGLTNNATAVDEHGDIAALSQAQITMLLGAGLGGQPKTIELGSGLGAYRLAAVQLANDHTLIMGMPTAGVDVIVDRIILLIGGGTLLGLIVVGAGGTFLIRRNLEPLARVAATARRVSTLKLDSGDVALAERVRPADTDPRTEVGQVGLALNSMLDNVDGALRSRQDSEMRVRQFVADASHELRTPLASIRGYAELSRREKDPVPPGVTHALSRVESEAKRMTSLVEDLLLLARIDEGRPLDRDEVDLTMLAINAVSDAHAASPDHGWELDLPDEPVTVTGDKERLHQVLGNLLANARTHTPVGTRVVTSIRPEGEMVRLSVTDNGPGIPESLQRKVFERFTRGDDSRSRAAGSTGLGLSIVAAVGQAHGGTVAVESEPGQTRFSVLIPA